MAVQDPQAAWTRRGFLGASGAVAAGAFLAACGSPGTSSSSGGSSAPLKFWNQPWGGPAFNPLDKKITTAYKPAGGLPAATYQVVQWANFLQTYTSAIASNTGPAVSSGGGTQAFLFAHQGKIAYADHLLDSWRSNGIYDDFLPGLAGTMKTAKGYAAVPYNLDMRVLFYNASLLDKAGAKVPTDWQSWLDTAAALKKIDVYGYGAATGAGTYTGFQGIVSLMVSNGGGLFDENQQPNCVTPANIEAVNYVLEMVSKGYVDPRSVSYTDANLQSQFRAEKFGMGIWSVALGPSVGGSVQAQLKLTSPLTSASGKTGTVFFPNNIMMYTNTPSQKGSEAFLTYYYKNMAPLWTQDTGIGLPPLKSIVATKEFQADANNATAIKEWLPVSKTWGAPGTDQVFLNCTVVDGTPIAATFAQSVLGGKTDAKSALSTLQGAMKSNLPS
jgi:multiple sugar transport system substrate-binding protein